MVFSQSLLGRQLKEVGVLTANIKINTQEFVRGVLNGLVAGVVDALKNTETRKGVKDLVVEVKKLGQEIQEEISKEEQK